MIEAEFLPFLDVKDVMRLSSVNTEWRKYFNPSHGYKINYLHFITSRLGIENESAEFLKIKDVVQHAENLKQALEVYQNYDGQLIKVVP